MSSHQFGIIDNFKDNVRYEKYEPEKYNCISVDMYLLDYIIDNYYVNIEKIKTYLCVSTQVFYGIDESGITIFPPESLKEFKDIVVKANSVINSSQLIQLIHTIDCAIKEKKHLIHFGI